MLNTIRKFSKTMFAKIIIGIIIIPFVFWGMGSVFNSGNTNNIVKINNKNISTQDFMDHLNFSNISNQVIKDNLKNNILEDVLGDLISKTLLEMEVKEMNLNVSEESLAREIKSNKNFLDKNNKFSRTKYEKFLISRNLEATSFEKILKERMLRNNLFQFVSGGVVSPYFIANDTYKNENKKIDIKIINLENLYKKRNEFTENEIDEYLQENKINLESDFINFAYSKITPQNLTGLNEYSEIFFEKIDELENRISDGENFQNLIKDLKIKYIEKTEFQPKTVNNNKIESKIYQMRNESNLQVIEHEDFFVLFEIKKIIKKVPNIEDAKTKEKILTLLYEKDKNRFNFDLFKKITAKKFGNIEFSKLSSENNLMIDNITINSVNDNKKVNTDSIKLLYSMPEGSFALITDNKKEIYLSKIEKIYKISLDKESDKYDFYIDKSNNLIKENVYSSYDILLGKKYNVKINQKTLERVKNFFR